jgi:hypothetical protein
VTGGATGTAELSAQYTAGGTTVSDTATVSVIDQESPFFDITTANAEASSAQTDGAVSTTVTNIGGSSGEQTVSLVVNGSSVDTTTVTLTPNGSQSLTLTWPASELTSGDNTAVIQTDDTSETVTTNIDSGGDDDDSSDDGDSSDGSSSGGGGGVPPSATNGTGVDAPDISSELGDDATISGESEAIIVSEDSMRATATFAEGVGLLRSVTLVKQDPFAEDIDGTILKRSIRGEPVAVGTPSDTVVSVDHVTMPEEPVDHVELRYEIPASRLSELDTSAAELTAHRFDGSDWQAIETDVIENTETTTMVTAEIANTTTSYFALTAPSAVDDSTGGANMTETDTSSDSGSDSGFPWVLVALIVAGIVVFLFILRRHRQEDQSKK